MIASQNICKRRLRAQAGFSLVELLVTLLIVVLVSIMVATGVAAAQRAYANVMDSSNAQLLLSTTITELRDEIDDSTEVAQPSGVTTYILYVDGESGFPKKLESTSDGIKVTQPSTVAGGGMSLDVLQSLEDTFASGGSLGEPAPLITQKTSTLHLKVIFDEVSISTDNSVVTFKGLKVRDNSGKTLAEIEDALHIRRVVSSEDSHS